MVFTISCAFAGPLLSLVGEQSGGFHLRGPSSTGKSTALDTAASVWGLPKRFKRTWRATVNGLEGIASVSNDGLLILDELGQVDSRDAGDAAYMLANGIGKARASRSGMAKPAASWTLLFLSAGEISLEQHMRTINRTPTAGQELRMAEVGADAGAGLGVLEDLHRHKTSREFIEKLDEVIREYHGAAGQEYLQRLVKDRSSIAAFPESLAAEVQKILSGFTFLKSDSGAQVQRVARRFALVAFAGELATRYGLTGWEEGHAIWAAGTCLRVWLDAFGDRRYLEERKLLAQVRAFFEAHGSSRFQNIDAGSEDMKRVVYESCGYCRDEPPQYLVFPEAFRNKLCAGLDHRFAASILKANGYLIPDGSGKNSQPINVPGLGKRRLYVIDSKIWEDEETE